MAAAILPFNAGAVGVVGPHPEAPADWNDDAAKTSGKPVVPGVQGLFRRFVAQTVARRTSVAGVFRQRGANATRPA
jgi:hypothetical protein